MPERITLLLPKLNAKQQRWVLTLTAALAEAGQFELANPSSSDSGRSGPALAESATQYGSGQPSIITKEVVDDLGVVLIAHHNLFSGEAFSKDKFEYALARSISMSGRGVELATKGFRGRDLTVDGVGVSLKTQADSGIKRDIIWVSKWMELGKGTWAEDPDDLRGLVAQFLAHMQSYDRIFTLRSFKNFAGERTWHYELVEIPKPLMLLCESGELKMMMGSRQMPKPGYCIVRDEKTREVAYNLYFDGGGERKLQVTDLKKKYCIVHATWDFSVKTLADT